VPCLESLRFRGPENLHHHVRAASPDPGRATEHKSAARRSIYWRGNVQPSPSRVKWNSRNSLGCSVRLGQRDGTQLHHVTVEGLAEWIAWWDAQEASA